MNENVSKIFITIEMLVLMLPTSFIYVTYGLSLGYYLYSSSSDSELYLACTLLFCLVAIVAGWYIAIKFLVSGRSGLEKLSIKWKVICYTAGLFVISSWLIFIVDNNFGVIITNENLSIVLMMGIFGTLLLIPLAHLSIEWNMKKIRDLDG